MKISRQVGTTNEILQLFVQDATVSTGAGLANLQASSFSSYWCRNDQTSTSSIVLASSAASSLGLYASGKWLEVNSTFMRGWYQLSVPDGVFASSRTVALHLYGHPSMAPVPIEIELTRFNNQGYVSSQPHNVTRLYSDALVTSLAGTVNVERVGVSSFNSPVGVSSFNSPVGVSSFGIAVGVSSISAGVSTSWFSGGTIVTSAAGVLSVNVSSIQRDSAVTTAAGILAVGAVGVSSFGIRVGVSSFGLAVGVSSNPIGVNVTSYRDTAAVTTFAGYPATYFDLGLTNNSTSTVSFSSLSISSQPVTVGSVDVTSFYGSGLITTEAGVLSVGRVGVSSFGLRVGVSSFNSPVGVSSFDIPVGVSSLSVGVSTSWFSGGTVVTSVAGVLASHVTSMRVAVDAQIADRLLARNVAGGSDTGRIVTEALYFLRNRSEIAGGVLTVYQTDDTTSSWAANVTTTAGNPISQIDPT